jgi:hypothetical protein
MIVALFARRAIQCSRKITRPISQGYARFPRYRPALVRAPVSMARESPGSGDDQSPDGRQAWGDRTVKEERGAT